MTSRPTPSRAVSPPELFGRETELATLRSLVSSTSRSPNSKVTIVGPPGIGKSALARALGNSDVRTSRRRLKDDGEVVVELGPLDQQAALHLFVATFARSRPEPPLSEEELSHALALVDHPSVDRMPLAIELVASRAALIGVKTLLVDNNASQAILESMRLALEDCYAGLESDQEREALERLSVFRGTFDLEGAKAMDVSAHVLAALRESSLVRESAGRFALHGVVRDFAFEKLAHGNGDPLLGLRAILVVVPHVIASGGAGSLIPLLSTLLEKLEEEKQHPVVGNAYAACARLRRRVGQIKEAETDEDAALAIATATGDLALEGRVLGERAFVQAGSSPAEQTRQLFDRAARAQEKADDKAGLALTLLRRAGWQRDGGALTEARADAEAAFALASTVGHRAHVVHALVELSLTLVELDDDDALKMLDKTKLAAHEAGERFVEGYAELGAGMFLHARGALDSAANRHTNALEIVKEVPRTAECIRGYLAVIALEKSKDITDELEAQSQLRRTSALLREAGEPRYAALFEAFAGSAAKSDLSNDDDGIAQSIRALTSTPSREELDALDEIAKKTSSDLRIALRVTRKKTGVTIDDGGALVIGDDGSWLNVGGNSSFDLSKHRAHGAILVRLANAHIEARGEAVSAADLIAVAWPNERIEEASAQNRLRVALAALRKFPVLKEAIITSRQGGGYFLDPTVSVRLSPSRLTRP